MRRAINKIVYVLVGRPLMLLMLLAVVGAWHVCAFMDWCSELRDRKDAA